MFSENGRIKSDKEVASKKSIEYVVICETCGHEFPTRKKIFGEKTTCTKCGSTKLVLDKIKK